MSSRASKLLVGGLLVLALTLLLAAATLRPLWLDEIYTLTIAKQPTFAQELAALREGCDGMPPLYATLVKTVETILGPRPLAVRLPSFFGYTLMILCVFANLRRRVSIGYAFLGVFIAALSAVPYSMEGRPYGLVLGMVSLALVLWQWSSSGEHRRFAVPGVGVCLAIGIALHYYVVLVLAAFWLGEFIRWWGSRRLDWPLMAALALPLLILLPHIPLIESQTRFLPFFWSKVSADSVPSAYEYFFRFSAFYCLGAGILLYWLMRWGAKPPASPVIPNHGDGFQAHEWAVAIYLALLPCIGAIVGALTTHIFVQRYVASTVIGVALVVPGVLERYWPGNARLANCLIAAVLSIYLAKAAKWFRRPDPTEGTRFALHLSHLPPEEPILITNSTAYLELTFNQPPEMRRRLVFVNDLETARRYLHADTNNLIFPALARRMPLNLVSYEEFLSRTPRFAMLTDFHDGLFLKLLQSGVRLMPLEGDWALEAFEGFAPRAGLATGANAQK